jgi:16S rRNA processing protein RimM
MANNDERPAIGGRPAPIGGQRRDDTDLLLVGRVARAHGNRGQVIVNLDTDFPEDRFRVGGVVLVGADRVPRTIRGVRFHQGRPIIQLDGIDTMNDAEGLAGAELKVPAAAIEALPEGTFHHHDLIGCDVRRVTGGSIGTVTAVEGTMEMSRLVVAGVRGEVLIPLVADICVGIDVAAREIVVNPPEGLIDLNAGGD